MFDGESEMEKTFNGVSVMVTANAYFVIFRFHAAEPHDALFVQRVSIN
jgi:hypothetical protein